jgi:LPXTG-motif cell wall-anchored protein
VTLTTAATTTTTTAASSVLGATLDRVTQIGSSGTGGTSSGTAGTSVSGSKLATTGSTVRPFVSLAVGLVAIGALILLGRRRRQEN